MVTQTNRFKAAAPGAAVSNMTSAYSGIRWGSGLPRQFQYEHSQSRIGGGLWGYPARYSNNPPPLRLFKTETPLPREHKQGKNVAAGEQGVEFFSVLPRL